MRSPETCAGCATVDCIKGTAGPTPRPGCQLWLYQPAKFGNMDCTFCLDCARACPHANVTLAPRLPGVDLWHGGRRSGIGRFSERADLAALVVVFTFGALLNAFAMVSPVYALEEWLAGLLNTAHELPVLALIFAVGLVLLLGVIIICQVQGEKQKQNLPGS